MKWVRKSSAVAKKDNKQSASTKQQHFKDQLELRTSVPIGNAMTDVGIPLEPNLIYPPLLTYSWDAVLDEIGGLQKQSGRRCFGSGRPRWK